MTKSGGIGWKAVVALAAVVIVALAWADLARDKGGSAWWHGSTRAAASAEPAGGTTATPTLFRRVRLFDGERVREATDVLVANEIIVEVGEDLEAPDDAEIVAGEGRTLLPGLIDSHTHVYGPVLREALAFGVTTELDMFTEASGAAALRAEQAAGKAAGRADVFSAGFLATSPGGHGTEYGLEVPTLSTPAEADAFVEARLGEGSDYLKIVYEPDSGRFTSLDLPTVEALIEAAHRRELLAVVHVSGRDRALEVIEAGADGIVHAWYDRPTDEAIPAAFAEAGVFVVPTLAVIESVAGGPAGRALMADERIGPWVWPASRGNLETEFRWGFDYADALAHASEAVGALHAAGVAILAGTDAPNPGTAHGSSLHRELELLVAAGLTPDEALAAATAVPAAAFGLEDRGRVQPGMRADLLLVDGDPTVDILATRAIAGIWKEGLRFDRDAYRAAIEASGAAAGTGLISSFDHGEIDATIGVGWNVSTDSMIGGTSTARYEVAEGGADGTAGKLVITGDLAPGMNPWAGPMLIFGEQPFAPANLSAATGVSFWARGDAGTYAVMFFAANTGQMPVVQTVQIAEQWQRHDLEFAQFGAIDPEVVQAFLITPSETGPFRFEIDELTLR